MTLLLLSVALIAAACGGDDDDDGDSGGSSGGNALSTEDYFERVEQVSQRFDTRGDAAVDELISDYAADPLDAGKAFIRSTSEIFNDFVDDLRDINPSDAIADLHGEAFDATAEQAAVFEEIADRAQDADSEEELGALFDELDNEENELLALRVEAACTGLEDVAAANSIDVDLACPGEE